jgi:glycosyltransferase involved in cell wall biosynthesis
MRVYFVENENPGRDSTGGIMTYITSLSGYLRKREVETILLGAGPLVGGPTAFSRFLSVVEKEEVPNPEYWLALFKKIRRLKIKDGTIIHAQRPDMLVPFVILKRKAPLICTLHGAHDLAVFDKKGAASGRVYRFLQWLAFRRANRLIAVDAGTRDYYLRRYRWLAGKITVIPTGIDMDRFRPVENRALREPFGWNPSDKIILFLGRLEKEKNLPFLMDAFYELKKNLKGVKLALAGRGREEAKLKLKAKDMNLSDVVFMGEIDKEKVPALLCSADLLALCSFYEGSPTVIKEALACNVPVVSFDVGDVREVMRGIEGCHLAERNPSDFAQKMLRVLSARKRTASRERMSDYSIEAIGQRTLDIYISSLRAAGH